MIQGDGMGDGLPIYALTSLAAECGDVEGWAAIGRSWCFWTLLVFEAGFLVDCVLDFLSRSGLCHVSPWPAGGLQLFIGGCSFFLWRGLRCLGPGLWFSFCCRVGIVQWQCTSVLGSVLGRGLVVCCSCMAAVYPGNLSCLVSFELLKFMRPVSGWFRLKLPQELSDQLGRILLHPFAPCPSWVCGVPCADGGALLWLGWQSHWLSLVTS